MSGDVMSPEPVPHPQRPFKVDAFARGSLAEAGFPKSFVNDVEDQGFPLFDQSQAGSIDGDALTSQKVIPGGQIAVDGGNGLFLQV